MLIIRSDRPNTTEIERGDGALFFFSYDTLVAAWLPGRGFVRTSQYWSKTTTKHLNHWLYGKDYELITQEEMEKLDEEC